MKGRTVLAAGTLAGLLAVALGAFGAHALEPRLPPEMIRIWNKAVDYQGMHALALLFTGLLLERNGGRNAAAAAVAFAAGILLFSGSLYLLALTGQRSLGMVTPLGGLAFLAGWGLLLAAVLRRG